MTTPESSDLDRLLCDLEFENHEYIKEIKQEELKRKDFKNRIEEIKLKNEHEEQKTPYLDEETKHLHSQFTLNREHVQNYKKTLALSNEHIEALKKKLPLVTEKMIRDREEHENILQHYKDIQEDYRVVYENFELTKVLNTALQNKAHAEEMWREYNAKAEELRSHIREFTNKSDGFTPYLDINSFIHKLAEIQIKTLTTESKMREKVAEELSIRSELKRLQAQEKKEEERKLEEEIKKKLEQQRAKQQQQEKERKRLEEERKRSQSKEQMAKQQSQAACQDQRRVITASVAQPEKQSSPTNFVNENYKPQRMDVSRTFQQRIAITPHVSTSSRLIFPNIPVTSISERQGSRYTQPRLPASQQSNQFAAKTTSLIREVHDGETQKIVSWPSLKLPFKPSIFMQQAALSQSSPILTTMSRVTGGDDCRNPVASGISPVKPVRAHSNSGGRLQMPSQCAIPKIPQKRFSVPLAVASQISPKRPIRGDAVAKSAQVGCLPSTNTSPPISHREYVPKLPQTPFNREPENNRFSKQTNTVSPAQSSSIDISKSQEKPNEMSCTPEQQKTQTGEPVESPYDLGNILSKVTAPKSPADCFAESSRAMFAYDETEQQKGSSSCAEFQDNLFFHRVFGSGDAINSKSKDATATTYDKGNLPTTEFNFGGSSGDAGQINMETNIFGMFGNDTDDKSSDGNSESNSFSLNFGGGDAAPNTSTFSFF